jgi:type IV pilus assembly protein PilY1
MHDAHSRMDPIMPVPDTLNHTPTEPSSRIGARRILAALFTAALPISAASMDDKVVQTTPYDPNAVYDSGTTAACDDDNMVYISSAGSVPVSAFNRLTHGNKIYFSVYQPDSRPHWPGNVKKYTLEVVHDETGNPGDANNDGAPDLVIRDANGENAVSDTTGLFTEHSRSFWTPDDFSPDGGHAGKGGMASRLFDYDSTTGQHLAQSREQFVYTVTGRLGHDLNPDLTHPHNRVHESNALIEETQPDGRITRDLMGSSSLPDTEFTDLLKWARGVDVRDDDGDGSTEDGRPVIGAPLHTRPYLVTYRADHSAGTQNDFLFIFTNDGYVHMTAADEGAVENADTNARLELWSFIPPELLRNLKTLYDDREAKNITYGVDGGVDLWLQDGNKEFGLLDENAATTTDDHAYLYFGLRRGGKSYYALDVSDPGSPRFLWSISGDQNVQASTTLAKLGQTWSRPRHTRVYDRAGRDALAPRDVIIFGGGYDTRQDNAVTRAADSTGNAIFIVDAKTAELLWWVSDGVASGGVAPSLVLRHMNYSIPADIRVVDINGDGIMDRFYAADMGGQIWRFDIDFDRNGPLAERIGGGRIADLQQTGNAPGDSSASSNRRFYNPPDVALVVPDVGDPFHALSIGSGFRARPGDTQIQDRIYVIKDYDVQAAKTASSGHYVYNTLNEGDLLDVTNRFTFEDIDEAGKERLNNGWYITLEAEGEKALSSALTANNIMMITTFVPADGNGDTSDNNCAPGQGTSRLYALDVVKGRPVANLSGGDAPGGNGESEFGGTNGLTASDRFKDLEQPGIAPEVTILFPEGENVSPIPIVGTELIPGLKLNNEPQRTYWYQQHEN